MKAYGGATLGVIAVVLAACGDASGGATSASLDGPVMRYRDTPSEQHFELAEVRGRLELEGSCLYLALDEVGERFPIVWPAGTTWDADSETIVSPSEARMRVGTEVRGAGGYHYVEDVERKLGSDAAERAGECVDNTHGEIAFINNDGDQIGPAE